MARNFYRIFTENNPVMGDSKTFGIPEAKGLNVIFVHILLVCLIIKISNAFKVKHSLLEMRIGECTVAIVKFITNKDRSLTIALKMVRHQLMLLDEYMGTNWFGAK